jgi:hypothetical protein
MSGTYEGTDGTGSLTPPSARRWIVPLECPQCGAPVDQAVKSASADPRCDYCHQPLPTEPYVAQQQPQFTPFRPLTVRSAPFGGYGPVKRSPARSRLVLSLIILVVIGLAVGIPLAKVVQSLPSSVTLPLGHEATLSSGDDNGIVGITVKRVIFPYDAKNDFFTPTPGTQYAVAEVTECGGPNYNQDNGGFGLDWSDFDLLGRGQDITPDPIDARNPGIDNLPGSNLDNKCETGWITFEFPQKATPTSIKYLGQIGSMTYIWTLSKRG